jgi:HK97 family phage major capsid protein/HK97 family phage prohead protease
MECYMPTIKTGAQYRHLQFDRAAMDTESRTIDLAFSSEEPYERFFGTEVLDHDARSIRLDRMQSGGPLLVDHDPTDIVGVIEAVEIGQDRVGRAKVRFGNSARAQEVYQDVLDGIRRNVSVGYITHKMASEKSNGAEVMRAVDWEPLEISIVAVPADPTVGIGRNSNMEVETEIISDEVDAAESADQISERAEAEAEAVHEFIEVIENTIPPIEEKHIMSQVDLSPVEVKQYSYSRAMAAALDRAEGKSVSGFEVEVSQDMERELPTGYKRNGGIFVPLQLQRVALATSLYNTAGKGAETVFTEPGDLIDMLRNASVAVRLGARMLTGLQGPLSFPKQLTASAAYWMPENDGTDTTASNATLGSVTLTPKTLQATTAYSRQLLAQSTLDIEALVRADMAAVHALAWDAAVLHGAGNANQPTGIYAASNVNAVAMGGVPTYGKLVDMITEINKDNAILGEINFITTPGMAGKLAQTLMASSAGSNMIWDGAVTNGRVVGYSATSSNQVSATLGGGTEHGIIAGDFSQVMIGMWGGFELVVDPYALKKQGMVEVTSFQMVDIALRHAHAFCKSTGATI